MTTGYTYLQRNNYSFGLAHPVFPVKMAGLFEDSLFVPKQLKQYAFFKDLFPVYLLTSYRWTRFYYFARRLEPGRRPMSDISNNVQHSRRQCAVKPLAEPFQIYQGHACPAKIEAGGARHRSANRCGVLQGLSFPEPTQGHRLCTPLRDCIVL